MTFIGCNVMGSKGVGSNIYQPFLNPVIDTRGLTDDDNVLLTDDDGEPLIED